nr:rhodanese-like domain-containing protein [Aerococcus sanguinicola]
MMSKKLLLLSLTALTSLSLAACADNTDSASSGSNDAQTEATADQAAEVKTISGEELDEALADDKKKEDYLVIDVRPEDEYKEGHVKWAINIPVDELENNLDRLSNYKKENVVTICNTGNKSQEGADILAKNGFEEVYNADGVKDHDYSTMTQVGYVLGDKFQEMVDNNDGEYYIIDARKAKDYDKGHVKGAVNIEVDDLDAKKADIPKDKTILTYCYSGNKSNTIAQALTDEGYNTINATEGTKEWDGFDLSEK